MKCSRLFILAAWVWGSLGLLAAQQEENLDTLPLGASSLKLTLAGLGSGKLMDTFSGREATVADIVERSLAADVIILGEFHDSYECHRFQKEFIEALAKRFPKVVVGFEFFERGQEPLLDTYRNNQLSEDELLRQSGWYARGALNYGYTRLVMEMLKAKGIPAIGLNVPRALVRKVSMSGYNALSAEEKWLFPTFAAANTDHEYYIKRIFGDTAVQVPQWFENFYGAQKCWDAVMAETMRQALARPELAGYKGVIIAGAAHVAYGLGIPFRYRVADPSAKIITLVPIRLPEKKADSGHEENPMLKMMASQLKPTAVFSRGLADFVMAVPADDKDYFPTFGFTGRLNENKEYTVGTVEKGSLAEKWGLREGDVILAIDGQTVAGVEDLRWTLAKKNWKDEVVLTLRRKAGVVK